MMATATTRPCPTRTGAQTSRGAASGGDERLTSSLHFVDFARFANPCLFGSVELSHRGLGRRTRSAVVVPADRFLHHPGSHLRRRRDGYEVRGGDVRVDRPCSRLLRLHAKLELSRRAVQVRGRRHGQRRIHRFGILHRRAGLPCRAVRELPFHRN